MGKVTSVDGCAPSLSQRALNPLRTVAQISTSIRPAFLTDNRAASKDRITFRTSAIITGIEICTIRNLSSKYSTPGADHERPPPPPEKLPPSTTVSALIPH